MGMYYNRARYYDVENGRFNAFDDWEGKSNMPITLNKYLYTHGNPTSYVDPTGNFSMAEVNAVIAKGFKFTARIASAVTKQLTSFMRVMVPYMVRFNRLATFAQAASNRDLRMLLALRNSSRYNKELLRTFRRTASRIRRDSAVYNKIISLGKIGVLASTAHDLGVPIKMNGLPDFSQFRQSSGRNVVFIELSGQTRPMDNNRADKVKAGIPWTQRFGRGRGQAALDARENYTWHHHEVVGIMELVRTTTHGSLGHDGGVKFWEILNNQLYRDR